MLKSAGEALVLNLIKNPRYCFVIERVLFFNGDSRGIKMVYFCPKFRRHYFVILRENYSVFD